MSNQDPPQYPDYGSAPNQGNDPWSSAGANPPPPSYPPMGAPGGYGPMPTTSQKATWAMVTGILSLVCCGPAGIVGIILGSQAKKEIEASGGALTGTGQAQAGFILGIIGVSLTVLVIIFYAVIIMASTRSV